MFTIEYMNWVVTAGVVCIINSNDIWNKYMLFFLINFSTTHNSKCFRYLATGWLHFALCEELIVSRTVIDNTKALQKWSRKNYVDVPDEVAHRFHYLWNPWICLGRNDGKHIRIHRIPASGCAIFRYRSYHSLVAVVYCKADGLFTTIDVGHAKQNRDGRVLRTFHFCRWLGWGGLNLCYNAIILLPKICSHPILLSMKDYHWNHNQYIHT